MSTRPRALVSGCRCGTSWTVCAESESRPAATLPMGSGRSRPSRTRSTARSLEPRGSVESFTPADSEYVSIRMAHVHLADVPGHVGRRPRHVQSFGETALMHGIDVIDEDHHPRAGARFLLAVRTESLRGGSLPATSLSILAKKDLEMPGPNAAEKIGRASCRERVE